MATLKFLLLGDSSSAERAMSRTAGAADKTHSHLTKLAKVAAVGFGAAAAGIGLLFKTGFDEAKDASAGTAQLAAGIKSTGNAAHVSVDGLNALAGAIQGYSGQTDDSIVKSEQLLLTFTNIKNSGPDKIFDLATIATADMAAKMGGDASAMAVKLGKALNDPVKGITALTKVGVSFTAAQKDQVKAMVAAGNTVGAQKLILGELNTEFGGAAKAAGKSLPGQLAILKRSFEDVSQRVVTAVLPSFIAVAKFTSDKLLPIFGRIWKMLKDNLGPIFAKVKLGMMALVAAFKDGDVTSDGFVGTMEKIGVAVRKVVNFFIANWPKISNVIQSYYRNVVGPVFSAIVDFLTQKIIPAVRGVVDFVVQHWPQIKQAFVTAWGVIKPTLQAFGDLLKTVWDSVLKPLVQWVRDHWSQISTAFKVAFIAIAVAAAVWVTVMRVGFTVVAVAIRVLAAVFGWFWHNIVAPVFNGVVAIVRGAAATISAVIRGVGTAVRGISGFFSDAYHGAVTWIGNLVSAVGKIPGKIVALGGQMATAGRTLMGKLWEGMKNASGAVADFAKAVVNKIIDGLNFLIPHRIHIHIPIPAAPDVNINIPLIPNIPHLALGGRVRAGMPYVVGENRPELFVPDQNGRVHPRVGAGGSSGGGGGDVYITLNGIAADQAAVGRALMSAMAAASRQGSRLTLISGTY